MLKKKTNNINGIHEEIKASDHNLQTVTNFKYMGAIISDAGSKAEMVSRIVQCTTTMTRLKPVWNDQNITLRSKVRLMRTLIISILLYACETVQVSNNRITEEDQSRGNEMLPPPFAHIIQKPHHK